MDLKEYCIDNKHFEKSICFIMKDVKKRMNTAGLIDVRYFIKNYLPQWVSSNSQIKNSIPGEANHIYKMMIEYVVKHPTESIKIFKKNHECSTPKSS